MARGALAFIALTACRTAEVRNMKRGDLEGNLWTRPASVMKTKRKHRVPLSKQAVALVEAQLRRGEYVFSGKARMGQRTVGQTNDANGLAGTVHGWRSTFLVWARNHGVDHDLQEQ